MTERLIEARKVPGLQVLLILEEDGRYTVLRNAHLRRSGRWGTWYRRFRTEAEAMEAFQDREADSQVLADAQEEEEEA